MSLLDRLQRLSTDLAVAFKDKFATKENLNETKTNIETSIDNINIDIETIRTELGNKASAESNHDHTNLSTLEKLVEDGTDLTYNSKAIMTKDLYDSNKDGIIDKSSIAIKLEGQLITLDELNTLSGIQGNVQDLIDAISKGTFVGEYATIAERDTQVTSPKHGDKVYITTDENNNNQRTQYFYSTNVNDWVFGGSVTSVNDAASNTKGVIQLSGDLTGSASAPELAKTGVTAGTYKYASTIEIDDKGRVISIVSDDTLLERVINLENRPQIYVSSTQPTTMKNGDFWIVTN